MTSNGDEINPKSTSHSKLNLKRSRDDDNNTLTSKNIPISSQIKSDNVNGKIKINSKPPSLLHTNNNNIKQQGNRKRIKIGNKKKGNETSLSSFTRYTKLNINEMKQHRELVTYKQQQQVTTTATHNPYTNLPRSVRISRFIDSCLSEDHTVIRPLSTDPIFIKDPLTKLKRIGTPKNGDCYFSTLSYYLKGNFEHAQEYRFLTFNHASIHCFYGTGIDELKSMQLDKYLLAFKKSLPNYNKVKNDPNIIDRSFSYALVSIWKYETGCNLTYYSDDFIKQFRIYLLNSVRDGVWTDTLFVATISANLHCTVVITHYVNETKWIIERLLTFKGEKQADEVKSFLYIIFYNNHFDLLLPTRPKKIIVPSSTVATSSTTEKGKSQHNDEYAFKNKINYNDTTKIPLQQQLPIILNDKDTLLSLTSTVLNNVNIIPTTITTNIPLTLKLAICNIDEDEEEEGEDCNFKINDINNQLNSSHSTTTSSSSPMIIDNNHNKVLHPTITSMNVDSIIDTTANRLRITDHMFLTQQRALHLYCTDIILARESLVCTIPLIKSKKERKRIFDKMINYEITSKSNRSTLLSNIYHQVIYCFKYNYKNIINFEDNDWIFHVHIPSDFDVFIFSMEQEQTNRFASRLNKVKTKILIKSYRANGNDDPGNFTIYNKYKGYEPKHHDDDNNQDDEDKLYYGNHIVYILCMKSNDSSLSIKKNIIKKVEEEEKILHGDDGGGGDKEDKMKEIKTLPLIPTDKSIKLSLNDPNNMINDEKKKEIPIKIETENYTHINMVEHLLQSSTIG